MLETLYLDISPSFKDKSGKQEGHFTKKHVIQ